MIDVNKILPRTPERLKVDILDNKYLKIPIEVIYAKDLKKYVIIDGHHRYYQSKSKGIKKMKIICNKFQKKTKFIRGMPTISNVREKWVH